MRQILSSFFQIAALSAGLLLTGPAALAQIPGGMPPAGANGGLNGGIPSTGMPPNESMTHENHNQPLECNIFGNMRRNFNVEMEISKLALTHSGNADVEKFSRKVIGDNLPLDTELSNFESKNGSTFIADVSGQTVEAEDQMEKLSGQQFDQVYLAQMDAYVKNDQQLARDAAAMVSLPDVSETGMRVRILAEQREKRIAKLAAEEYFKIE